MHAYLGSHFTETVMLAGIENIHLNSDVGDVYDFTINGFDTFAEATVLTINYNAHNTNLIKECLKGGGGARQTWKLCWHLGT